MKRLFGENSEIEPEQITCEGCRGSPRVHWSPDCGILLCCVRKQVRACSECSEMVCHKLREFYASGHEEAKANALRQREVGLEEWWKEERNPK